MIQKTRKIMNRALLNHKIIIALALIFYCATVFAQVNPAAKKPDPISSVKPAANTPAAGSNATAGNIREKLVKLAMQNPDFEIADRKVSIASYQVNKAKGSWLSAIAVQGNLNEFAFSKDVVQGGVVYNRSTFYPKYNIGVNIPFNIVSDRKNEVKIAKENLSIAEAEKNQRFRQIKAEVLTKYEDFLLCQQRLEGQSQIAQDARAIFLAAEKDFQEGAIKQEDYNRSYRSYTDEKIKQAEYVRNYNVIKLELEAMIGVSMDDLQKK